MEKVGSHGKRWIIDFFVVVSKAVCMPFREDRLRPFVCCWSLSRSDLVVLPGPKWMGFSGVLMSSIPETRRGWLCCF